MPELPKSKPLRRGLFPCIGGKIVSVSIPLSHYRPIEILPTFSELRRRVLKREIIAVERLGKRVVCEARFA